mgnify:CR=1 FL=1|tara:strand:- start:297 stop:2765 length:2469 start_codon:yes stop_codon:yes gene_type:complete
MAPTPATITVTPLNGGLEVKITQAYESSGGWVPDDVFYPFVEVVEENGTLDVIKNVDVYTVASYPNGLPSTDISYGQIVQNQIITFTGLTNKKHYSVTFQPKMTDTATSVTEHNVIPQNKPSAPILGSGVYDDASKNILIDLTVNDALATKMNLTVIKQDSTDAAGTVNSFTTQLNNAALNLVRSSGKYTLDLSNATVALTEADVITVKGRNYNSTQMSIFSNKTYTLAEVPESPASLTVVDVSHSYILGTDHSGPFARNGDLLATFRSPTSTVGVIDSFELTKLNAATGNYDAVVATVAFDVTKGTSTDYEIAFNVDLGSVAKYGVRSVKGTTKGDVTMSGYVAEEFVNSTFGFVAEQLTTGFDAAHPSTTHDSFKLTFSNGVSSFINRDISAVLYTNDAGDSSDSSGNMALRTAHTNGTNGTWDVAADGTATMYGFTPKLEHGDKVKFTIEGGAYGGLFSEAAITHASESASRQALNGSGTSLPAMDSNEITVDFPLIKPNDPSNVVMTPNNGSVMVNWQRITTTGTGGNDNNKADYFNVRLYNHSGFATTDTPLAILRSKTDEEFVFFNGLDNDVEYYCTVQAVNAANPSGMVRATSGATPLVSILSQLLTVSITNTDSSLNFVIDMAQSAVDISNIFIQPILATGANDGSATTISVAGKTAVSKTATLAGDIGLNEFYVYATSTAQANSASQQAVVASNTPFLHAQHTIAIAPTIDGSTVSKAHKGGEGTNTDPYTRFSVNIDNEGSELTLAKVVAIPAAPTDAEDLYTGSVVHDLIKGLEQSANTYKWSVNIPYHLFADASQVVMAANAFGNDQDAV